jgi:hypothetical protein
MHMVRQYPEWLGVVDVLELTGLDVGTLSALVAVDEFPVPLPHEITGDGPQWGRGEVAAWRRYYGSADDIIAAIGAGWLVGQPEASQ